MTTKIKWWTIGSGATVAVGRFRAEGLLGYRAASMPDAPLRASRAEAAADEISYLEALHPGRRHRLASWLEAS